MQMNKMVATEGKVPYYQSDGTGRDTYIREHNGGLLTKDRIHHLKQYRAPKQRSMKFGKNTYGKHPYSYKEGDPNKFVHYISDGSGRDNYVTSTEGGNSYPFRWRNQTDFKFKNSLHQHDRLTYGNNPEEKQDIFSKTQTFMVGTMAKFHRTMPQIQSEEKKRLSIPKKVVKPPPIPIYFHNKFDVTRQFNHPFYNRNTPQ